MSHLPRNTEKTLLALWAPWFIISVVLTSAAIVGAHFFQTGSMGRWDNLLTTVHAFRLKAHDDVVTLFHAYVPNVGPISGPIVGSIAAIAMYISRTRRSS